jgi:N,N-dimethylformamidase beta subunit-like, C-terminal/Concanavalin A-like lectin/glucanases superfamily
MTDLRPLLIALSSVSLSMSAVADTIPGMKVVGYADRLSVQPGETIKFMVSSELPRYRADIVRLIHGDTNPRGPGYKEELVQAPVNREYPGRSQALPNGSYVTVPDNPALRLSASFTLQAWIYPTTPAKGVQGLITKWTSTTQRGYGLVIDEDGSLALWLGAPGQVEKVRTGVPFPASVPRPFDVPGPLRDPSRGARWYFVAATFDATAGKVVLYQRPLAPWPIGATPVVVERTVRVKSASDEGAPLLIGASWLWREAGRAQAGSFYNGKIESPRVFGRALTAGDIDSLAQGGTVADPVAAWDFSAGISSRDVTDRSPNRLNGRTVNMPTRAVTGYNWTGNEIDFKRAPAEYGAIHFHDDDLDDAAWEVGFEWRVPDDLKSGIYAARLRAGNGEDYAPFYVRPRKGTATAAIAFLVPTFSYLAYANSGVNVPQLLSLYNHHSDGSGVAYSSHLRPILNMRPKYATVQSGLGAGSPHQLNADLHLIDWLENKGFKYDVITDHDLHLEGLSILKPYKVILTGSHPEYWSGPALDGIEEYLENGGRLMYLGGNGFYWVTALDPGEQHTVEIRRYNGTQTWHAEPGEHYLSTTGENGGLWRSRGRPPQALVGVGFSAQGRGRGVPFRRMPGSFDPRAAFIFEGIGPDELIGDFPSLVLEHGAAGWEVDRFDRSLGTPDHALLLATSVNMPTCPSLPCDAYVHVVEEVNNANWGPMPSLVKGDIVYFEYPRGGAVFSSSSISWDGSLSYNNYTNNVSRMTENVLRRFASDGPLPGPPKPTSSGSRER